MKQTVVEFLLKRLKDRGYLIMEDVEQAKEMERRQKAEEYLKGFKDGKEYQIKFDELTFKQK